MIFNSKCSCEYVQVIVFTVKHFNTKQDFLKLYDGDSSRSVSIADRTGQHGSEMVFMTTQQFLYVQFTSGAKETSTGFEAEYKSVKSTDTLFAICDNNLAVYI